jgi:hypothetical protein
MIIRGAAGATADERDDPVEKVNAAKGSKGVDAAVVVNELVAQRERIAMMAREPKMMRHVEHIRMGMIKGMMESMNSCP